MQVSKKNNNPLSKLSSQIICHFQIFEQCAYYIISHNLLDSEQRRRRTKAQHVAIFPPARFSQLRVQCFFLALKKGSNNLASGSIFCSPLHFLLCRNDYIDDDVVVDSCRPVQRQEILSKNISSGTNLLAFWVE